MHTETKHEPANREIRQDKAAEPRTEAADAPTACGLTREELRAIVVEMIG